MSIVACRNIMRNEEVLVSYNYDLSGAPEWYKDLWQHHKRYMAINLYIFRVSKKESEISSMPMWQIKIYLTSIQNEHLFYHIVGNIPRTRDKNQGHVIRDILVDSSRKVKSEKL